MRAIASLKRLAKKWPPSLLLFAGGGRTLSVRKGDSPGMQNEVDFIIGFPNDCGDGGDEF